LGEACATLPEARMAHRLALFLAEETVRLNQAGNLEGDQQLTKALESEFQQAQAERDRARQAYLSLMRNEPVEALEAGLQSLKSRRFAVERTVDAEAAG
jgi:hypothetical protein